MIDLTFVAEIKAFEILIQSVFQIQGVLLRKFLNKDYIFIVHFIVFIGLGRFLWYSWNLRTATPNLFFPQCSCFKFYIQWINLERMGAVYTSFLILILSLSCSSGLLHTSHTPFLVILIWKFQKAQGNRASSMLSGELQASFVTSNCSENGNGNPHRPRASFPILLALPEGFSTCLYNPKP